MTVMTRIPKPMKPLPLLFVLLLSFGFAGCASTPPTKSGSTEAEALQQLQLVLQGIFAAAERKDFVQLDAYHLYGAQFSKFGAEIPGRQDSTTTRLMEHTGLGNVNNLQMQAQDLKLDLFGDVAIATFIMDYTFDLEGQSYQRRVRSTIVFVRHEGAWKIAHEHFSPWLPNP